MWRRVRVTARPGGVERPLRVTARPGSADLPPGTGTGRYGRPMVAIKPWQTLLCLLVVAGVVVAILRAGRRR